MTLKVSSLVQNNGQLGWLPKNPRQWTQTDIDRTAASIREDEDFLEDRPLLVVPKDAKTWVVFAGNLRLTAAKKIGLKEVPCIAYARETDEDDLTIKRRAMKDNGAFGAWDYDALANEWDDLPLQDWGVPSWKEEEKEDEMPEDLDATLRKKEMAVKLVFDDENKIHRFTEKYRQVLIDEYGCTISISGGEL